jgi:ABC-type glycerol-3-phosphate transport system substrate-binding protein
MNMRKLTTTWPAVLAAGLLLAACGGGGNDSSPVQAANPLTEVPASASQSEAGLVSYLESLRPRNAEAEALEPALADSFTPPTADSTEPQAVSD